MKIKKLKITVKTNSKIRKVIEAKEELILFVSAPPVENKANKAVIELLAEHFKIPKSKIEIVHGHKSRKKLVAIII